MTAPTNQTLQPVHFSFTVGKFECIAIADGHHDYPPENFFSKVAREEIDAVLRERNLPTEHITTPYTCLFINTGQHRVMIDIGASKHFPHAGRLLQNMQTAGVSPVDIDTIIITHAHPDHVGGNLDDNGQPVCPNAQYFIWKSEWEFWTSDTAASRAPERHVTIAREYLKPVEDRLNLIDHEGEIVPGISAVAAPGHTPGHIAISVISEGERLLHIADVVLYPLHLEYPDWVPIYDIIPQQAAATKHRIFDLAAKENLLVFAHHFPPFPNLGKVVKRDAGWLWQPIA